MSRFVFRFESLLRYRQSRRDQCLQLLAQILADEDGLKVQQREIERARSGQLDELKHLIRDGEFDVDRATSRRYYAGQLVGVLRHIDQKKQVVLQQQELCRQALLQADREVKTLEKLKERQFALFREVQQRHENRELEEAWRATQTTEDSK